MQWSDLLGALCLVLIIEGMMPFLAPGVWRNGMRSMAELDDPSLRRVGFISMVVGAALLFLVR